MEETEKSCIYKSEDGYLYMPNCRISLQEQYKPIIEEISNFFKEFDNENIHSVYLRGSLVWGLGIEGLSDVDLSIITLKPLTGFDLRVIRIFMDKLNEKYPFVTRFDLGYFVLDQIFSAKENVLIKLSSICIYGEDIKDKIKNPRPGRDLTISLSLLEGEMLKTKNEIKMNLYDKTNTKTMCTWIMKRIVRSGLEIVSEREGCFTRDLRLCLEKFSKYYPDKKEKLENALFLAINPTDDLEQIKSVFEDIGGWIVGEGKALNLISEKSENIDFKVVNEIKSLFNEGRIVCLLRYGPKTRYDGSCPEDFDFLLMLDEYQNNDYALLSSLNKLKLPIEVFIDYKDQIRSKGIKNYQRGRHGSYFFKILSSAKTLIGTNFYKENEKLLDGDKINHDLLYRIEEYFYRIQKSVINNEQPTKDQVEKYLGRILTDLMLVNGDIQFNDVHNYHYTDIIFKVLKQADLLNKKKKNLIVNFASNSVLDINLLGEIIGKLYEKYALIRREIIK